MPGGVLPDEVVGSVVVFFSLYFICYGLLTIALMALDLDFPTSASAAVTALSNVGPGIGDDHRAGRQFPAAAGRQRNGCSASPCCSGGWSCSPCWCCSCRASGAARAAGRQPAWWPGCARMPRPRTAPARGTRCIRRWGAAGLRQGERHPHECRGLGATGDQSVFGRKWTEQSPNPAIKHCQLPILRLNEYSYRKQTTYWGHKPGFISCLDIAWFRCQ